MPGRIIAIGDIHGCSNALQSLVETVAPAGDDVVIPLGDYVDRGPDSRAVLDQLIGLAESCQLWPLLGNHEEMMLGVLDGTMRPHAWLPHGGIDTLESYGFAGDLSCIPANHRQFLRSCRDYIELDRFFFVHANYDPRLPLPQQTPYMLRWESLEVNMPGPHRSGKVAVVGHTPDRSGEILDVGYLKCLDTYCYGGQWLTAMDLTSGQVWQANDQGQLRT